MIKKRRFLQLLKSPDLLKQPAIKAAMKAKLAYHSAHDLDVSDWKLIRPPPPSSDIADVNDVIASINRTIEYSK